MNSMNVETFMASKSVDFSPLYEYITVNKILFFGTGIVFTLLEHSESVGAL